MLEWTRSQPKPTRDTRPTHIAVLVRLWVILLRPGSRVERRPLGRPRRYGGSSRASRLGEHGLLGEHAVDDRHVGDEVDEAGRVAPLVVVPRDELDEGGRQHDARARVEDGRAGLADEVRRHDLVLGVADDALGVRLRRELDLGLDVLVRGRRLELARQVDDGDVDGGHAEGHAGQLALHHRVRLGDGLRRAGRRRDDVGRRRAARAPVSALHGAVDRQLRRRGGVHGGHEALLDAELLVDRLDDRRQAVRRARRARNDRHVDRVLVLVDADDERRGVGILGRGRDDDLLGAALNVLHAARGVGERTGGLADVLDAGLLPRDLGRVAGRRQGDRHAVDREAAIDDLAGAREAAVHSVVLQEVLHVLRRHGRVDVLEHERLTLHGDADDLAANAAEAVDTKLDRRVRVGRHDRRREAERGGGERQHDYV